MAFLHIAANDLRQIFKDKKALLFMLVMPLGFTAGLGFALADVGGTRVAVRVLEAGDDGVVARALVDALGDDDAVELTSAAASTEGEREGRDLVARGRLAALIVVPDGLDGRAAAGPLPALRVIADPADEEGRAALAIVDGCVAAVDGAAFAARAAVTGVDGDGAPDVDAFARAFADARAAARARAPAPVVVSALYAPGATAPPSGFDQASPGLLVQFAIMSLLFGAGVVFAERRAGVWRRLLAAPVRGIEIVVGHGLATFAVIAAQSAVLVVVGDLAFGVAYRASPLGVAVIVLGLSAWVTGLGLIIAVVARREEHVILFALLAMFFFTGLGGAWVPLEITGEAFARIGGMLPSGLAMKGLQDVILRGRGFSSTIGPGLGLTAWTIGSYAIAAALLRRRGAG